MDFWVVYAARKDFAFDVVFWKKLDNGLSGYAALPNALEIAGGIQLVFRRRRKGRAWMFL